MGASKFNSESIIQIGIVLIFVIAVLSFGIMFGVHSERNALRAEAVALGYGEYYIEYEGNFENVQRSFRWKKLK